MDNRFPRSAFNVTLEGPMGSGKTVALKIIEEALLNAGYEIDKSRESERGFEHAISVKWSK